jgi:hypothetical protein
MSQAGVLVPRQRWARNFDGGDKTEKDAENGFPAPREKKQKEML